MCVFVYVCVYVCMHVWVCVYEYMSIYMNVWVSYHSYIIYKYLQCIHTPHTHTHIYTHIHTHIHTSDFKSSGEVINENNMVTSALCDHFESHRHLRTLLYSYLYVYVCKIIYVCVCMYCMNIYLSCTHLGISHSLTHSLTHLLTHSRTHSHSHSLPLSCHWLSVW